MLEFIKMFMSELCKYVDIRDSWVSEYYEKCCHACNSLCFFASNIDIIG